MLWRLHAALRRSRYAFGDGSGVLGMARTMGVGSPAFSLVMSRWWCRLQNAENTVLPLPVACTWAVVAHILRLFDGGQGTNRRFFGQIAFNCTALPLYNQSEGFRNSGR